MAKKNKKPDFSIAVKNKKIPILTLDVRWHALFSDKAKTSHIKDLEKNLNNLLKKQGKLGNDIKDMKKLKKKLMKDIVVNMDIGKDILGKAKEKKLDKNKQYIEELNTKIKNDMDELSYLPYQIKEANEALTVESMKVCFDQFDVNIKEIEVISDRINQISDEFKIKMLLKQNLESKNNLIYTYMHDLLGAEIMESFDSGQKTTD